MCSGGMWAGWGSIWAINRVANTEFDRAYFERMAELEDRHPWTRPMRQLPFNLLARRGAQRGDSLRGGRDVGLDYAWPALPLALRRTNAAPAGASASELPFGD